MVALLVCFFLQLLLSDFVNMPLDEEVPTDAFQNNNLAKEAVDTIGNLWRQDVISFEGGIAGIEEYINVKNAQKSPKCGNVRI